MTPTSELPHFGAVGGMPHVKQQLEESVGLLLAFADEAADYKITFNGILLHGPPGTGKTFLAKAVAGEFGLSFMHVTAADLVSKYVGETARNVEAAFQTAAANVPSLLFFDEFDAIGARRDDDASAEDRRAVAQLLTSLERHRTLRDLVVFVATNDLERLDPAVVRPGRFDRHVRIDLPDADGREAVLRACLKGRPAPSARTSQRWCDGPRTAQRPRSPVWSRRPRSRRSGRPPRPGTRCGSGWATCSARSRPAAARTVPRWSAGAGRRWC